MTQFIDRDFLLETPYARDLYHNHAAKMPIIDYHCHLDPKMVADDHRFNSITELWLGGDHYKWRAMRSNGIDERYITGSDTSDRQKFEKWAETVPYCMRNPLYHWTHMELRTAFGIDTLLNPDTAADIYERCNEMLRHDPSMTARGLMSRYNVEIVCTTDDPVDSLEHHARLRDDESCSIRMLPTWRPDKAMNIDKAEAWRAYVHTLGNTAGVDIRTYSDMTEALQIRHDFFESMGCRLSDHGLDVWYADDFSPEDTARIFDKAYSGQSISPQEISRFKSAMLVTFGEMDSASGWVQQFHYGALRDNNSRMYRSIGPDTGFDSIDDRASARECSRLLDRLDSTGNLAKTIIYNLNPSANEVMATMIGNFQDGLTAGKIQLGSGWWFLDQKDGMQRQLNALSLLGLLSRFVGMLTDSRSFVSYPRHEYFRRTLCNLIGNDIAHGELPFTGYEEKRVRRMVEDICYYNARHFFNF